MIAFALGFVVGLLFAFATLCFGLGCLAAEYEERP